MFRLKTNIYQNYYLGINHTKPYKKQTNIRKKQTNIRKKQTFIRFFIRTSRLREALLCSYILLFEALKCS